MKQGQLNGFPYGIHSSISSTQDWKGKAFMGSNPHPQRPAPMDFINRSVPF